MTELLKILFIAEDASDAQPFERELEAAGYPGLFEWAGQEQTIRQALAQPGWDCILSAQRLPGFDAEAVLAVCRMLGLDTPVLVFGPGETLDEPSAARLIRAGAKDCFTPANMPRFAPILEKELEESFRRGEYRRLMQSYNLGDARYRAVYQFAPISLWEVDFSQVKVLLDRLKSKGVTDIYAYLEEHPSFYAICGESIRLLDVNATTFSLYCVENATQFRRYLDTFIPRESGSLQFMLQQILAERTHFEYETIHHNAQGARMDIRLQFSVLGGYESDYARVFLFIQDIRDRKAAERELQRSDFNFRSLVEQLPAAVYQRQAVGDCKFLYISPKIEEITGSAPQCYLQEPHYAYSRVHPDDYARVGIEAKLQAENTGSFAVEYRHVWPDGKIVWLHNQAELIRDEAGRPLIWQGIIFDITETRRAEADINERERRLSSMMSSLPGMAIRSRGEPDFEVEYVSEGCLLLTGYTAQELTADGGLLYGRLLHRVDLAAVTQKLKESLRASDTYDLQYRIITRSGQEKWVWHKGQVLRGESGLVFLEGIILDVSESRRAEAIILRQLADLDALYSSSVAVNGVLDPQIILQRVMWVLRERMKADYIHTILFNKVTGVLEQIELLYPERDQASEADAQKKIRDLLPDATCGLSGWVFSNGQVVRLGDVRSDGRYITKLPGIRSGLYVPMKNSSGTIGVMTIESELGEAYNEHDERLLLTIANHTAIALENAQLYEQSQKLLQRRVLAENELRQERNLLEQHVQERTAQLAESNAALEKALRVKDDFLAAMSHELRTPLTGILGLAEALQYAGNLSEKQANALRLINQKGRQLLELITDIFDYAMMESRQLKLYPGLCQIQQFCHSSAREFSEQAVQKQLRLLLDTPPEGVYVLADGARLSQMINNLLNNAVKFTPEGGEVQLGVQAVDGDPWVRVSVRDTGIGIAAEDIPRLFRAFTQLDQRLSRLYNGTGLGLAIVDHLVRLHGGRVEVSSAPGQGSCFSILLPRVEYSQARAVQRGIMEDMQREDNQRPAA